MPRGDALASYHVRSCPEAGRAETSELKKEASILGCFEVRFSWAGWAHWAHWRPEAVIRTYALSGEGVWRRLCRDVWCAWCARPTEYQPSGWANALRAR